MHTSENCSMVDVTKSSHTGIWDRATGVPDADTGLPRKDEFGRLNSMYFFSGVQGRDEDLLNNHKVKLDRKRERQWESERESRISQIKEQIALRESNGTDESQQVVEAIQEEEDADMDAFIPMSNIEFTLPDASAPSSDIPGLPLDAPAEEAMEEPSPFAPLPALP